MRFDGREWLERLGRRWRGSLQLRTIFLTVALSTLAVTIIGLFVTASVRSNLFESRRDLLLDEAGRATLLAQQEFTQAGESTSDGDLVGAQESAILAVRNTVSTDPLIAFLRVPDQEGPVLLEGAQSPNFSETLVSTELAESTTASAGTELAWQSIVIPDGVGDETTPGIIVGSLLTVPQAGLYQLYIVYDLADVQSTLDFVQLTLVVGGVALVVLIGLGSYLVVRLVVGPVRVAAATSEKLADGQLEERLPERGQDELATLARSFNRMADSLQRQIRQLAELSRLQQRFVSDVSHELRTPLTTIRLAGDVLYDKRAAFEPATARTAELLHAQTERFEVLLADLLEMSRYDAGAVTLETEPTNLVRLVEDAIEAMAPLAAEHGSDIRLVAPGGYFEAEVDARRIRRILQNLLGNAIDHGEGRPIVAYVDSDATAIAIAVRDYGVGMEGEQLDRVFDRFWRADPSRQRRTGGTGLGLAISLEDAVLHDGVLEVWSEPGQGTCFRLTLPRTPGDRMLGSPLDLPPDDSVELRPTDGLEAPT